MTGFARDEKVVIKSFIEIEKVFNRSQSAHDVEGVWSVYDHSLDMPQDYLQEFVQQRPTNRI